METNGQEQNSTTPKETLNREKEQIMLGIMGSRSTYLVKKQQHFVLIHGACHGAWCWYKVETLLKSAGHRVTSLDMSACGIDPKQFRDVESDEDLYEPLTNFMETVSMEDQVILVGHSYGGMGISMAMESFSDKIFAAVFISASMPGPTLSLADIGKHIVAPSSQLDNQYEYDDGPDKPPTSFSFGPEFLSTNLYNTCPPQDLTLATKLVRPMHIYTTEELTLSDDKYGSINRAYIITDQDKISAKDFQLYMVKNNPPDLVKEIKGSGHMVMLSKPQELFASFQEIVQHFT